MNTSNYNTLNNHTAAGLFDAEGSFIVSVLKDTGRKLGYILIISVEMGLNHKDKALLDLFQNTLGVGNIYYNTNDKTYKWKVSNLQDINSVILAFFTQYRLFTPKRMDFVLFSKVIDIVNCKNHLTLSGMQDIINIKASLNLGLSPSLILAFPNTVAVERIETNVTASINPFWLKGFTEGEGCFFVSIYKSPKSRTGWAVQLVFKITQHIRDVHLLNLVADYLKVGRIEIRKGEACDFTVTSIKDIENVIVPFFFQYPLQGSKLLNFESFNMVVEIMKAKGHLTEQGIEKIRVIKSNMNILSR